GIRFKGRTRVRRRRTRTRRPPTSASAGRSTRFRRRRDRSASGAAISAHTTAESTRTSTATSHRRAASNEDRRGAEKAPLRIPPFEGGPRTRKRPISHANHLPLIPLAKRPFGAVLLVRLSPETTKAGLRRPSFRLKRAGSSLT